MRHRALGGIATETSREMASTSSPRKMRKTTSFFRITGHRFASIPAQSLPSFRHDLTSKVHPGKSDGAIVRMDYVRTRDKYQIHPDFLLV
jgi:hypothetical protein